MGYWFLLTSAAAPAPPLGVVPVLVGPLQALLALLPAILVALGGIIVAMFKPSAIKRFLFLLWAQKFVVLGIAVVVVGLIYIYSVLFPPSREAVGAQTASGSTEWPLWRGGPERRGWVPGAEDPAHGKIVWSFWRDEMKTFYASPAIVGNRLYITSARYEYFKDEGAIYSIDIEGDTPKVAWTFKASKYRSTFSSPAVWGKYLVVGEGLHLTNDARVFCIDVRQSEQEGQGVKLWEYRTKSHVESSPCIADGKAFIGAGDDGLYCFALDPDENGNARILWHLDGKTYPDCETAPVVHDGKVYFSLGLGGHAVVCVDAADGREIWKIPTSCPAFGSPSISNGKLFVGMGYGDFVNTAEQARENLKAKLAGEGKSEAEIEAATRDIRPAGEVWCIDLATQKIDWKYQVGRTVLGTVAVDGDRIYFGSRDRNLYCLSTKGELIGAWNAHAPIVTSPAVADKHVYVITGAGQLYGVDKAKLSQVWSVGVTSPKVPPFSSPVVAYGHVYVGTSDGGLKCVGLPGREKEKPIWSGALGGPGKSGWLDRSVVPAKGEYAWSVPGGEEEGEPPTVVPEIHAPAASVAGAFYVGLNQKDALGLAKFACGDDLDRKPRQDWFAPSRNPVYLSAAATEEDVFFVDGRPGDADRALQRLDATNGQQRSRYPVATDASGEFVITHDRLLIADTGSGLTCLDLEAVVPGRELWKALVGPCVGTPALLEGEVIVAIQAPPRVAVLDLRTGMPRWETPLPSPPRTGPVAAAGKVWVGLADGVRGFGLADGTETDAVACGEVVGRLVCDEDRLVCVTQAGELVLVDAKEGKEVTRIPEASAIGPVLCEDGVLYLAKESIQRYEFGSKQNVQWARVRASWPGTILTPMIIVDSRVFFATDKEGFVCMKPKK